MPEYILYDKQGEKHIFNHMIDVRTAMETGLYSAERPEKKKRSKPKASKPQASNITAVKTEKTPMEKMKEEVKTKTDIDKMEEKVKERKP